MRVICRTLYGNLATRPSWYVSCTVLISLYSHFKNMFLDHVCVDGKSSFLVKQITQIYNKDLVCLYSVILLLLCFFSLEGDFVYYKLENAEHTPD
jgi:hypothetical protein